MKLIDRGMLVRELILRFIQTLICGRFFDFPPLSQIRNAIYRRLFSAGAGFSVGRDCALIRADLLYATDAIGELVVGSNVAINHGCEIEYSGGLTIQDNVWISQNTLIETHDHVFGPGPKEKWKVTRVPLTIEREAWVGANVTVLSSVRKIGAHSIVAAGAVVTKDVPPWVIVGGVPARVLRKLKEDEAA